MALFQSDILQHNNPNLAVVDSDFSKGGFRTAVAEKEDLYALSGKTDEPSAAGQLKEYATFVYVTGETKYYVLTDINNVGNASGWEEFKTGGGSITDATNGLSTGLSGTTIALGGDLTGDTYIDGLGQYCLGLTGVTGFRVYPTGSTGTQFSACETGITMSVQVTGTTKTVTLTDDGGFKYGADYSSQFTARSLIDKAYADNIVSGLKPKEAVDLATTPDDGNIVLSGISQTLDGQTLIDNERVLIKNQTDPIENGIYITSSGSTWTRSTDFDGSPIGEVTTGSYAWVLSGETNRNTSWVLVTEDPEVDITPLEFVVFNHVQNVEGGYGIKVLDSGDTHVISVNGTPLAGNSITWTGATGSQSFNVDITSGTLSTALNNKLNVSVFTGYTGSTVPITGVTNVGGGSEVYSGTSGNTGYMRSLVGSGSTQISTSGDTIIIRSDSTAESQQYSGQTPSAIDLGGISAGYDLTGKTLSTIIQDLLVPELFQTTVGTPSTTIGLTETGILEIGYSFSQTITPTYSAGVIDPLYETSGGTTRGGAWNAYDYTGPGISGGFTTDASCTVNPYVVTSGVQTWSVCTRFDSGATVIGSKGTLNPAVTPNPLPQDDCTTAASASVTGILPWYWGTSSVGTITSDIITGGTKTVANVGASTPIRFNSDEEYLWFAAPTGAYTTKTKWWVCAANAGIIGGTDELWKQQGSVAVTSGQGCWSGCSFDVYVTCGITTTDPLADMCLYY